ncbi:MAG: tetratricopeptide repeat protein [bacterium]|jgi:TolA-binding protein|nr:tetratricopeptide repeat protein [bacterium]
MNPFVRLNQVWYVGLLVGGVCLAGMVMMLPAPVWGQAEASVAEQREINFADGLYQRGMYSSAAKLYREFVKNYPKSKYRNMAMFRQGESFYQQALTMEKSDATQANIYLLEAKSAFEELIKTYPKGEKVEEALLRHGEVAYKTGDAKGGLVSLGQLIKQTKDSVLLEAGLFYAARCHDTLGQVDEAIQRYRQIRDTKKKGDYAAYSTFLLAGLLGQKGENDAAIALYNDLWQNAADYTLPPNTNLPQDAQLQVAQLFYKLDRFDEASQAYQAFVKDATGEDLVAKATYGAAWAEYRQKNYARALELAEGLQKQTLPPELVAGILFLQGTCSYQQKDYEDATLYFREVIADPKAGEYRDRAWYQLCWSYYLSQQYERTVDSCNTFLQQTLTPAMSSNVHFLLGQAYARMENYLAALDEMGRVLDLDKNGEYAEEALYLKADLSYRQKQFQPAGDAFLEYYKTYKESPRAAEALQWACNAYFAAEAFEPAMAAVDLLLTDFPDSPSRQDLLYRKALAQYQNKQFPEALQTLARILAYENNETKKPDALYWTAYIQEQQGKRQEAGEIYARLIEKYPSYQNMDEVLLRKAICDYQDKNFDAAYKEFHAILETETGAKLPADIIFWLVFYADERDQHAEALKIADRILALFPQTEIRERALIAKGNQLVALEHWDAAQKNAELFLKELPKSDFKAEIHWSLAHAYRGQGFNDKASEFFEKSLLELQDLGNPDPNFEATLYMDRGRLFEALNETAKALESYLRVAIIFDHPKLTPEALYRSVRCHQALRETSEADLLFTELVAKYPDSPWVEKAKADFSEK